MAKHYSEKDVSKWTVNDFIKWFDDENQRRFGVDYVPMGGWAAERGRIGTAVGTQKKQGKYDKVAFKAWLERELDLYKPSASYPGVNIGFLLTYRQNELQSFLRDYNSVQEDQAMTVTEEVSNWFLQ